VLELGSIRSSCHSLVEIVPDSWYVQTWLKFRFDRPLDQVLDNIDIEVPIVNLPVFRIKSQNLVDTEDDAVDVVEVSDFPTDTNLDGFVKIEEHHVVRSWINHQIAWRYILMVYATLQIQLIHYLN